MYAKEVLRGRFFLGAFEMLIFAAIYNCNIYAFEDFDESTFLRWQRVDAPHPDAAAQDHFVYRQSHSNGHFDELRWIGPGAYTEAPLASKEGQKTKNAAAMEVDGEIPAEEAAETANASEDASQHQSDFLAQLARFEQLANLAEEDPESRARIAQEAKRKKKQRMRQAKLVSPRQESRLPGASKAPVAKSGVSVRHP